MKKIKYIILITNGRSGSEFFQSLLDGHSEITSFPGIFNLEEFYKYTLNASSSSEIVNYFIKKYNFYFKSKLNLEERLNKLGKNKNKNFFVKKEVFKNEFQNIFDIKKKNNIKHLIYCLHYSYFQAKKKKRITLKK